PLGQYILVAHCIDQDRPVETEHRIQRVAQLGWCFHTHSDASVRLRDLCDVHLVERPHIRPPSARRIPGGGAFDLGGGMSASVIDSHRRLLSRPNSDSDKRRWAFAYWSAVILSLRQVRLILRRVA